MCCLNNKEDFPSNLTNFLDFHAVPNSLGKNAVPEKSQEIGKQEVVSEKDKIWLDRNSVYLGEEVMALLARSRQESGGWTASRTKRSIKKDRAQVQVAGGGVNKKKRVSPKSNDDNSAACWLCRDEGHYKDECPYMPCRYCKKLGHRIRECPTLPDNSRRKTKIPTGTHLKRRKFVRQGAPRPQPVPPKPAPTSKPKRRSSVTPSSVGSQKGGGRKGHLVEQKTKTKCRVFIPTSDQANDDQMRLRRILGVIHPGHGAPTREDIIEGLRAISISFKQHEWKLTRMGGQYIARFPSAEGLDHVRTSIPCRGHNAGFTVLRWTGEEEGFPHRFPVLAWLKIFGFPLQNWNRCDLNKLLVKFAHVVEVSEQTLERSDLEAAHVLVGCDSCESVAAIPSEMQAVVGSRLYNVSIRVTARLLDPGRGRRIRQPISGRPSPPV